MIRILSSNRLESTVRIALTGIKEGLVIHELFAAVCCGLIAISAIQTGLNNIESKGE